PAELRARGASLARRSDRSRRRWSGRLACARVGATGATEWRRAGMNSTAAETGTVRRRPIVLIHGMWMTPLSWEHWADRYRRAGHHVLAPAWPGLEGEPEEIRRDPSPLRGLSIPDVIDHYEKIIRELGRPPIIIGHSFGGLYAQLLLNRGLGSAGAALGTGAPKGVLRL